MKHLWILLLFLVAGCTTISSRIEKNPDAFAKATEQQRSLMLQGKIGFGFTPEMVRIAWGEPEVIEYTQSPQGVLETWNYYIYTAVEPPYWRYHSVWHRGYSFHYDPWLYYGPMATREQLWEQARFMNGKVVSFRQQR